MTAKKDAKKRRLASKKKRQAQSRARHTGVMQQVKQLPAFRDADVRMMPAGAQKMSQVILEFARPLLDSADGDAETRNALAFAVLAWNASLMPEERRGDLIQDALKRNAASAHSGGDVVAIQGLFSDLIRRKEQAYPEVQRLIVDYHVRQSDGQTFLEVASTMVNVAP
jgi:hypothetical protein